MSEPGAFSFGGRGIAEGYDDVMVPILFGPWAARLVAEHEGWAGATVLDLASGTGVVARELADRVGPEGGVIASDLSGGMLEVARRRCEGSVPPVRFVESPANPLDLPDASVDAVVCQQGFQFFPDRPAAAREVARVLRGGGRVLVSTWRPVNECELFGWICDALHACDAPEVAALMRVPFDFLPASELRAIFEGVGFVDVEVDRRAHPMLSTGGAEQALAIAYGSPIGPKLAALSEDRRVAFRRALVERVERSTDGSTLGQMAANLLSARKRA
jgi:ubiquinone/menaquinone biosynthesis C-methylase UbiE